MLLPILVSQPKMLLRDNITDKKMSPKSALYANPRPLTIMDIREFSKTMTKDMVERRR